MSDAQAAGLDLPHGLPPWLTTFILEALAETTTLRENGADAPATARLAILKKLVYAADAWLNEELDTASAAQERGCAEETIRRAVRRGALPDRRANSHDHIKVLRRDLHRIADPGPSPYDPHADAQDLARLRRKA